MTAQQQEVLQEDEDWRTSETFANTSFVVAESSGTWSLEVGERNPADTLTKPLPGRRIREWSEHVGQRWLQQS